MNFSSTKNLKLAWKRVRTAQNAGYKRFYSRVFDGLDIGLEYQLADLRTSLNVQTFQPNPAQRVLSAKPSGLQRPLTFLDPRDQIVLQALVNVAARAMEPIRQRAVSRSVCSNRLVGPSSIFLFKPWHESYGLFRKRIEQKIKSGHVYAADFDLASFYDTISHAQLAETIFRRNRKLRELLQRCLLTWNPRRVRHGIPQGPAACDYLAECYLSSIDAELMREKIVYLRYVDDIIIFGKDPSDVQAGVLRLEAMCREHGLIPQAGKFKAGRKINRASELVKSVSASSSGIPAGGMLLPQSKTVEIYTAAISKKTRIIFNPTLAKRALFRGKPTEKLLANMPKDIERNPAFVEAYAAYLQRFGYRRKIARFIRRLILRESPYQFVQGEYWKMLLSASRRIEPSLLAHACKKMTEEKLPATLRLALYGVMLKDASRPSSLALIRALRYERTDWVRAWAISHFGRILQFPEAKRFASASLQRDTLTACCSAKLQAESVLAPPTFPLAKKLSGTAKGSLRRLGLIRQSPGRPPDAVSTLLASGFAVPPWNGWRRLLGSRYEQARICLQLGLREFEGNPSSWMGNVDSFNDIVIRCLMDTVRTRLSPPGLPPATDRRSHLTNYGAFLRPTAWFFLSHPVVCQEFIRFHNRRNHLTSSHAFDSLTATPSKPLKHKERQPFVRSLAIGYRGIQRIASPLL